MTRSIWLDDSAPARPALPGDVSCDVAVVGAGITGLAAAYWLRDLGERVIVLEGSRIGAGASGRNAGFLLSGANAPYPDLVARAGRDRARRIWQFTLATREALVGAIAEHGIECDYVRCGSLLVATSAEEDAGLRAQVAALNSDGFEAEHLDAGEVRRITRLDGFHGGQFRAGDSGVHPVRLLQGLARVAEAAGVRIYERTRALDVREGVVVTDRGTVRAPRIVLALNAYLPLLAPLPVSPKRGQMLATAPLPRFLEPVVYANRGYEYWRQLPDGRLVVGGYRWTAAEREVGYEDATTPDIQARLDDLLRRIARTAEVTHRWSGAMGFTESYYPFVRKVGPGVYAAGGYSGNGMPFAFLIGKVLADLVTTGRSDDADLFP